MVTRLVSFLFLCCIVSGCTSQSPTTATVTIAGETFKLELALNTKTRARGLMGRSSVLEGGGMLFVFPKASNRSFWMKNCLIPIDLLFLDSRGTITAVHQMPTEEARGPSESEFAYDSRLTHYWSNGPARYAIELESGEASRLGIRVNDRITLDFDFLRSIAR
jgi:uncharacterized membrane protein (UPF0127 family)